MSTLLNISPPSNGTKPRSNSNSNTSPRPVQHDQIPISNHSSASYKQELMDSSVLLDNINDLLSSWDNQQSNTHSLQPSYLFSPSFSSTNNTNNSPHKPIKSNKSNHRRSHRHPSSKSLKKSKLSKKSHRSLGHSQPSKSADFHQKTAVTVAGPHQTYYIKDDTSIRHKQHNHKNHHNHHHKSHRHHHHHRKHNHHNLSRTPINITSVCILPFIECIYTNLANSHITNSVPLMIFPHFANIMTVG